MDNFIKIDNDTFSFNDVITKTKSYKELVNFRNELITRKADVNREIDKQIQDVNFLITQANNLGIK